MSNVKYIFQEIENKIIKSKKIKKIFIHIGFHKTATTSIQNIFFNSTDELKKYEYFFPKSIGANHGRFLRTLVADFPMKIYDNIGKSRQAVISEISENVKKLNSEIKKNECENMILSGEDLSFFNKDEVLRLKKLLENSFTEAELVIVVSTRETKSFIQSDYQQAVKMGYNINLNNLIQFNSNIFNNRLANYIEVFSKDKIIIYKYEDACKSKEGVVKYFAKAIGIRKEIIFNKEKVFSNSSLSNAAMEILIYINSREPLIKCGKRNSKRTNSDVVQILNLPGDKYVLDNKCFHPFNSEIEKDKKWLKQELNVDYSQNNNVDRISSSVDYDICYVKNLILALNNSSILINDIVTQFSNKKISENKIFIDAFTVIKSAAEKNSKLFKISEIFNKDDQ